jgi:single-strand DNA-binding protein
MSGSLNKVQLIGNLGADPEIRRMNSGDPIVNLRIATSETWRDKDTGERKERTFWHQVVIFNENLVKVAEQYLKKGMKIYIEGALQTRKWQHQDGTDRYTTEVVLQKFRGDLQMLTSQSNRPPAADSPDDYGQASGRTDRRDSSFGSGGTGSFSRDVDDEIPF